jgi:two-component system sensor kinase FixL
MHERNRILVRSVVLMAILSLGASAVAIPVAYRVSRDAQAEQLSGMARAQAALIGAVGRFDSAFSAADHPDGALGATLSQLLEASHDFEGFGETGEFVLAERQGDEIVFLLPSRPVPTSPPARVRWGAEDAEPMRRALQGESGTVVAPDYRGRTVLAAYEPVPDSDWGVVAKIDMAEVRAPFIRAGLAAAGVASLLAILGVAFLWRLTVPLLDELARQQAESLDAETQGRLEAEESAEESRSRTRSILDTAVDSIITIDERGVIESANQATIDAFGYSEAELLGQNVALLMPLPYHQEHDRYLANYLESGQPRIIGIGREVPCRRKDGSVFPGDLAVSELKLHDRRCFTGILRDLTERKAAERDLESAEQRVRAAEELASVGTLVAGLAHEIGTPMGVIQGHAKLLEKAVEGDRARWRLQTIEEQIGRISRIIQSLLNMARPRPTERVPVDLEPLLDNTLSFVAEKFKRRGIEVVRHFEPTRSVSGDMEKLQQLLLNLLLNAADAMPDGGELRVSLRPDGTTGASIRIADTGVGIDPEGLERIFDAFYTSKEAGKGNGLGLMVASRIAADHGGTIEVSSEVGEGTEFHIRLPWNPTFGPPTRDEVSGSAEA